MPRRSTGYLIRLTDTELADLHAIARQLERPLSWWVRWCLFRRIPRESIEAALTTLKDDLAAPHIADNGGSTDVED